MPWLACPRCKKIKDDLAEKILEAPRHGEHWAARQRTNSNKTQRLHDKLNHVDVEPLVEINIIGNSILLSETVIYFDLNFI